MGEKARLSIPYSPRTGDGHLLLERNSADSLAAAGWPVRLYPAVPAKIACTRGLLDTIGPSTERTITREAVEWNGEERTRTKYPVSALHAVDVLIALDTDGAPLSPRIIFDPDSGELVTDTPFYGAAVVDYVARYRTVYYRYETRPSGAGTITYGGTIIAVYRKAVARLDMEIDFGQPDNDWAELYRVYSVVTTTPDGVWEIPPGWPSKVDYPKGVSKDTPDPNNSKDDEVVHERGTIDLGGFVRYDRHYRPAYKPYSGKSDYRPKYHFRKMTAPAGDDWSKVFQGVRWTEIASRITAAFPGIDGL